jgi:hypothetical protein
MAWLVWGPLLLMLTVLMLPWFLSGSLLWLLVCLLSPHQRHLTRISLTRCQQIQISCRTRIKKLAISDYYNAFQL